VKLRIQDLTPGRFLIAEENEPQRLAWAVRDRQVTWVFFAGRAYRLTGNDQADGRPSPRPADDAALALAAPMPATVTAVHVSPGQRVATGDVLITLEAMKMELPIVAPHEGVVRRLACVVGDLVQPGVPLAEIDAAVASAGETEARVPPVS
jgi:biotin carboxyl carrier protein